MQHGRELWETNLKKLKYDNGCYNSTQDDINSVCRRFDRELRSLICSDIPMSEWYMRIVAHMDVDNEIDMFNRLGVIFNH